MALDTTDPTVPLGSSALSQGDDEIRQLKQDVIDSFGSEHDLAGGHQLQLGSTGNHPTPSVVANRTQIFINNGVGGPFVEYYDGSAWQKLTDIATLLAHIGSTDLTGANGHVNGSVKTATVADAAITSTKLSAGSVGTAQISGSTATSLVNASVADTLHIHNLSALNNDAGFITSTAVAVFNSWDTTTFAINTIYQASTDIIVCMSIEFGGSGGITKFLSDVSASPTTERASNQFGITGITSTSDVWTVPVRKNDYWTLAEQFTPTAITATFNVMKIN